jgi:RNA polymerase sigma-32 factor
MTYYTQKDMIYFKRLLHYKMLEKNEEVQLSKRWHLYKDQEALNQLIQAYFKLVIAQAFKFNGYGLPLSDLIQEGVLGLMTAAKRFDPRLYDVRFSTYARWWIKAQMQDYILKNWSIVRLHSTTSSRRLFFNLNQLKKRISHIEGEDLSLTEIKKIATLLKTTVNDVEEIWTRIRSSDFSLNNAINHNTSETFETQIEDKTISPEDACNQTDLLKRQIIFIQKILSVLTKEEREVIELKYLSDHKKSDTLKNTKFDQKKMKNLESKAFRKIKYEIIHNKNLDYKDLY